MYNRYVPQPDGSFRKTRLAEPPAAKVEGRSEEIPVLPCHIPDCGERKEFTPGNHTGIGEFFKNLLPSDLNTEDLIVILLLLLLSQDRGKNGNQALLTLGAYLFL